MIAYCSEATQFVVFQHLFNGIVAVAACCRAVDDDKADAVAAIHEQSVFHVSDKESLVMDLIAADEHRECV